MLKPETKILTALENKAVDKYEAHAVVERVRPALFSNQAFVIDVRNIKITVSKIGFVSNMTMDLIVEFPNNKILKQGISTLTYTADTKRFRVSTTSARTITR